MKSPVTVADSTEQCDPYFGRRNCKRCTRWKLAVDFRWRWRKPRRQQGGRKMYVRSRVARLERPNIDTVCIACRREESRAAYQRLSPEERREYWTRVNERAIKRRQQDHAALQRAISNARLIAKNEQPKNLYETVLPLMPFRLWLLGNLKRYGGIRAMATKANIDEAMLRRYVEGIYWEGECKPRPISGITLAKVDEILFELGEQHQLGVLYPHIEGLDAL